MFLQSADAVDGDQPLPDQVRRHLRGGKAVVSSPKPGGLYARDALGVAAIARGKQLNQVELCVLLDDGTKALGRLDFEAAWREWLQLSNALQLSQTPLTIATLDLAARVEVVTPPIDVEVEISPAWRPAYDGAEGANERAFLRELAELGLPAPDELGPELGGIGLPVDYAWTELKVAVMDEPAQEDISDLAAEGWKLIGWDAEALTAAVGS